ncbi:MAG: hypothetical protein AB1418_06475 [Pseudomonadota bacterium]
MEAIEKLGVRVSNPEQAITLEGKSFADLVLFEYLRTENLKRCAAALALELPDGESERLAELQVQLQAMVNASSGVLQEYLRIAGAQGLRFEIVPAPSELH